MHTSQNAPQNTSQAQYITYLEPTALWNYFHEICQIPHPTFHEEKLISYLKHFAASYQLEAVMDKANNVVIRKPATPGFENKKMVILQSHLDMVPDKSTTSSHDFLKDPIQPLAEGDWVVAKDTTLGADNGIGVAATLAILASSTLEHGPIEALFTVAEEDGLVGAIGLSEDLLRGELLINLDTEMDGEFDIGCAGGVNTDLHLPIKKSETPKGAVAYKLSVSGLQGGHSGGDIHLGRGNAIKILTRILWQAANHYQLRLANIQSGSCIHNAIPREGEAIVVIPQKHSESFKQFVVDTAAVIRKELALVDPDLKIDLSNTRRPSFVFDKKMQEKLLDALYGCPHGVIDMSRSIPGLVQTSTNLGHIRTEKKEVIVFTLQRGSVDSLKNEIANATYCIFKLTGGEVAFTDPYPGWAPNPNSPLVQLMQTVYKSLFKKEPDVKAVHAGLECGIIGHKYPNLDMISIGPTLLYAHSPFEKVSISAVKKFWDFLTAVLQAVPDK